MLVPVLPAESPVPLAESPGLGRGLLESGAAQEELDAIRQDAEAEMDEAVKFADASPYPDPATVLDDMYVTDNERCVAR